jgi:alpha-N-arabinofuranosidase
MGIDDFYRWSRQAGTEIMLAINLGTRGLQEALDELEYVNGAAGTYLADLRVKNGIKEPMNIKMWCLGNEMDGPWQVGHQSPDEYARLVDKVAHAMKLADSSLDLVACGSSSANMTTFGTWEEEVLTAGYENLDFVSCHDYYSLRESGTLEEYAASTERMKIFISTVEASAEKARQAHQGDKKVALSFDEWGVWDSGAWNEQEALWKADNLKIHDEPWPFKPHLLEQIYTAADAVVEGSLMITLLSSCDVVRSASRAQLVNVIAPIMAEEKGPAWRQSVFYPFAYAARYAKGTVYVPSVESSQIQSQKYGSIDAVQLVVTREEATGKGCLLVVNRDVHQSHDLRLDISALEFGRIVDSVSVHNDDPFAVNSAQNDTVVSPRALDSYLKAGVVNTQLPPLSWSCIAMEQ